MRRLKVITGTATGQSAVVDRDVIIGREAADFVVPDPLVSRRHAVVRPAGEGVEIEDLASANGTFVDGERVTGRRAVAGPASLRVGDTKIEIEIVAPAEAAGGGPGKRRRRRKPLVALLIAAAAAAGVAAGLVSVLRSNGVTSRVFSARITTLPLGAPTSVVVSGLLQGRPVGRVTVIIQRQLARNPTPGGASVPFTGQMLVIAPKGAMGFDLKGALRLTSSGGEVVRGKGVATRGGGEFKNIEGSFTLTGGRPRAQGRLAQFAIDGTLKY